MNSKCVLFAIGLLACRVCAADPQVATDPIDLAAIAALPMDPGQAEVLVHLDLSKPFATKSQWTLVVVQDDRAPPEDYGAGVGYEHGSIGVCLVKDMKPNCTQKSQDEQDADMAWASTMFSLEDSRVVYAGEGNTHPLLWIQTCTFPSADGSCGEYTVLYSYDPKQGSFEPIFTSLTGSNNNQATRFMDEGPIRGDIVVNYPTDDAPYGYWIEVHGPRKSGRYEQLFKYRSHTHYNDGNHMPVTWSEMPEILRRLGLWKPGDALPVPPGIDCPHPVLRHGEEWCG